MYEQLDPLLQVLIDQSLWARLEREAECRSVSVSTLAREAIDERYPRSTAQRRTALDAVLRAPVMEVPSAGVLRREVSSGWRLHDGDSISDVDAPTLLMHRAMVRPA